MAQNPDVQGADELVPFLGMLRWIDHGVYKTLQQFQYSGSLNANDWYDVPEVMADIAKAIDQDTHTALVATTDFDEDSTAEIIEAGERADLSELTPPQTETEMIKAAKNAPVKVERSPPYAT